MQALLDLHQDILDMYAYHAELSGALNLWHTHLRTKMKDPKRRSQKIFFGRNDPNAPDAKFQYAKTVDKAIVDSSQNGTHVNALRRSVVVLTYAIWEDKSRQRIAYECQLENKNRVESDVFHDLNRYRQAVLHAGGRLVGEPKVIKFFGSGEEVLLTDDHIYDLFSILITELNRIGRTYYKKNPKLTLDQPFHSN